MGKEHRWLIFADVNGVGHELQSLIRTLGERCDIVVPGKGFGLVDDSYYQIDPNSPDDYKRLISQTASAEKGPYTEVIHMWAIGTGETDDTGPGLLERDFIQGCGTLLYLVQALESSGISRLPRLWVITRGAQTVGLGLQSPVLAQSPIWGLAKVVALEHPELRCSCVDLDPSDPSIDIRELFQEIRSGDQENQIAIRQDARYVARLVRSDIFNSPGISLSQDQNLPPMKAELLTPGILDTLKIKPASRRQPGPGEVEIRIVCTGLNFLDVLTALDLAPLESRSLGHECAGRIASVGKGVKHLYIGDPVVAIAPDCFSTYATVSEALVFPIPSKMHFRDAATIPVAFLTAKYALHNLARLSSGESILIHAATGGVGLAAVQLAQRAGAEIFATAGSPEKRAFLRSMGINHVMDSRSLDFAEEIMAVTNGRGVDVVLNSLAGDFIPKSLSVLQSQGRFLEIGKTNIYDEKQVACLKPQASYFTFDLMTVLEKDASLGAGMMAELTKAFESGVLRPLPVTVFSFDEVDKAFRYHGACKAYRQSRSFPAGRHFVD